MELADHLKRVRRAARDRYFGGLMITAVGFIAFAFSFFAVSVPFSMIGLAIMAIGGIVAGMARRRIEDIDTQILRGP
jgi:dolichol kinase